MKKYKSNNVRNFLKAGIAIFIMTLLIAVSFTTALVTQENNVDEINELISSRLDRSIHSRDRVVDNSVINTRQPSDITFSYYNASGDPPLAADYCFGEEPIPDGWAMVECWVVGTPDYKVGEFPINGEAQYCGAGYFWGLNYFTVPADAYVYCRVDISYMFYISQQYGPVPHGGGSYNYLISYSDGGWDYCMCEGCNTPPDICDEDPTDGSTNVSVGISSLSVQIWNYPDEAINWSIETSPDIGHCNGTLEWGGTKTCSISGLEYETIYTWFVNATDGHYWTREIYTFTTEEANNPPYLPSDPDPFHQETDVDVDADLSWTGGDPDPGDTVTYDVYFGTSSPPPLAETGQLNTEYDPGTLDYEQTYYWKIVAWDNHNESTEGSIWSFTTEQGEPTLGLGIHSGTGIEAFVINAGDGDATNIEWTITIEGGLIIIPREGSGTILSLAPLETENITMDVFGIGLGIFRPLPEITITAECDEGSSSYITVPARIFLTNVDIQI